MVSAVPLSSAQRAVRTVTDPWVAFFGIVLAAWLALAAFASNGGPLQHSSAGGHGTLVGLVAMWGLMSVAMMAPTSVPLLVTYRGLTNKPGVGGGRRGFAALVAGYLVVWVGFSVVAAFGQHSLALLGVVDHAGRLVSAVGTAGVLAAAGAYQFSGLKQACVSQCRTPLSFFLSYWRSGVDGALRMGLRHGVVCVGCCWALMLLAFVGGAMNLAFMGMAMVLMVVEKLPIGRVLTRPIGFALLAGAGGALLGVVNLGGSL